MQFSLFLIVLCVSQVLAFVPKHGNVASWKVPIGATSRSIPSAAWTKRIDAASRNVAPPVRPRNLIAARHLAVAANPIEVAASVLAPSSLGFWKQAYGVSLGYGLSIASCAYLLFRDAQIGSLGWVQALIHIIYGIRLSAFLAFREATVERFQKLLAPKEPVTLQKRLARIPFVLGVAFLYWTMSLPVFITNAHALPASSLLSKLAWSSLVVSALGLAIEILGDTHKYISKAKGVKLVKGGIFAVLRHPNYTGEFFLWNFSTLAALLVAAGSPMTIKLALTCVGAVVGALGISFVLAQATRGLERKQKEAYGSMPEYEEWVKGSWAGVSLPANKTK